MRLRCFVAAATAALALSACGGGGGGNGNGGGFTLDATSVRLTMVQNQPTIPARELTMQVTGKDVVYVGAAVPPEARTWLNVSAAPPAPGSTVVHMRISLATNFVAPGEYATTIQVGTGDANGNVLAKQDVRVTAGVVALDVTPAAIVLGGADGLTPGAKDLTVRLITNTAVKHPYAVALTPASGGWLRASAGSGTVGDAGQVVSLDADRTGLEAGTYQGQAQVTVTYEDLQLTRTIPVTLNLEAHRLVVGEGGVAFTSSPGRSVLARDVGVFSSLGRSVTWTASKDQAWLTVTPSGVTGEPLHLAADPTGLPTGATHFAEVTVSSPDAGVENTQKIRVGLTVRDAPSVDLSIAAAAQRMATSPVEPVVFTIAGGTAAVAYDVDTGQVARTLADVATKADALAVSPDGRYLYVYDGATRKTFKRDAVTGALVREFPGDTQTASWGGLVAFRPGGRDALVTPHGAVFDAETGAELGAPGGGPLARAHAVVATPDGTHLAGSAWFATLRYTALGTTHVRVVDGTIAASGSGSGQGCFTADGTTYLTSDCNAARGYGFCRVNVATGAALAVLPAQAYPAAMVCVWNGLVIGGSSSYYEAQDLYLYDQAGTSRGRGNSSKRASYRSLLDAGLAVSGDGVRLVSLTRPSLGYDPSDEIRFQTLPAAP